MVTSRTGDGPQSGGIDRPSTDTLFELLADERRRYVIDHVREVSEPVAVADLARRVADREAGGIHEARQGEPDTVRDSLYHLHVPRLVDADVLEHDPDRNTVERGPNFAPVADFLETLADGEAPDRS